MGIPYYSVVIPCYNSGPWVDELVRRISEALKPEGKDFEILLINDASPDPKTWPAIEAVAGSYPEAIGVNLMANGGQFRALIAGFTMARGDFVLTMDDDLQHPPEQIPVLIQAMKDNPQMDCIIGSYHLKQHSLFRNMGSRLVGYLFQKIYNKPDGLQTTSFRIMTKQFAYAVCAHRTARPIMGALVVQSSRRLMNVPVEHHPRPHGESGYTLKKLVRFTLDNVIHGSTMPLRAILGMGFVSSFLAFGFGAYHFFKWTQDGVVPGFTTLTLLIIFFGGMQLVTLGLLGEYVLRIINEVAPPPRFVVRETTSPVSVRRGFGADEEPAGRVLDGVGRG